jgi:hypothetical protein
MTLWSSEKTMGEEEAELISLLAGGSGRSRRYSGGQNNTAAAAVRNANSRTRTISLNVTVENRTIVLAKEDKEEEAATATAEKMEKDGGWGWIVVLASLSCLCLLDGISYSFGVLLPPLSVDLAAGGRVGVAAAGSLQTGIYSLAGLWVAKLVTR